MDTKKLLKTVGLPTMLGLIMFFDDVIVMLLSQIQNKYADYELTAFLISLAVAIIIAIFFIESKEKDVMIGFYAIMVDVSLKLAYSIFVMREFDIITYSLVLYVYCALSMLSLCIVHKAFCFSKIERESLPNYKSAKSLALSLGISCLFGLIIALLWLFNCLLIYDGMNTNNTTMLVLYVLLNVGAIAGIYLISTRTKINKSIFLFACSAASLCVIAFVWENWDKTFAQEDIFCSLYATVILLLTIVNGIKALRKKKEISQ